MTNQLNKSIRLKYLGYKTILSYLNYLNIKLRNFQYLYGTKEPWWYSKRKFYNVTAVPIILHGSQCRTLIKQQKPELRQLKTGS
jgi:hypothetical protein